MWPLIALIGFIIISAALIGAAIYFGIKHGNEGTSPTDPSGRIDPAMLAATGVPIYKQRKH